MRVAVIGFGKSGRAAYEILRRHNIEVFVFDEKLKEQSSDNMFFGLDTERFFDFDFDRVVVSPGVKPSHRFVQYAEKNTIEVISELELGFEYTKGKIIAITGTNGKSTTVKLVEKILKEQGKKAIACGNIGLAFCDVADRDFEWFVVEASSFQLYYTHNFRPHIAAILNVAFDHLSWHGSMENYIEAKRKIFRNQNENDFFIKNREDQYIFDGRAELFEVSSMDKEADAFFDKDYAVVNRPKRFIIEKTAMFGSKAFENIAFAAMCGLLAGVDEKIIKEVSQNMENLDHRIEYVDEIDGVKFYNDSKATNLDAVETAINSFDESVKLVVILGGKYKGESYAKLLPLLQKRVKALVVYGEDRKMILKDLEKFIPVPLPALNIWGAVRAAFEVAAKGDVVLFSPGGASCEPYKNFEERGEAFKKEVKVFKEEYEKAPLI